MSDRETIETLENRRYEAMLAGDIAALDELLDARLNYVHSSGDRDTKSSYLEKMRAGFFRYLELDHPVEEIVMLGDIAMVIGRMQGAVVVGGAERKLLSAATAIWRKSDGRWTLVLFQPTPLKT